MSNQLAPLWERYVIYVSLESKSNESGKFPCIQKQEGKGTYLKWKTYPPEKLPKPNRKVSRLPMSYIFWGELLNFAEWYVKNQANFETKPTK